MLGLTVGVVSFLLMVTSTGRTAFGQPMNVTEKARRPGASSGGLFRLLKSFCHFLSGFTVLACGDALNVFYLLHRGGSKAEHLQEICLRLF
jgi:hypothetical protein